MPNGIITVDRSRVPNLLSLPEFEGIKKPLNEALELHGPKQFSLSQIDPWLHPNQRVGKELGFNIFKDLKRTGEITKHLNIADGLAIQAEGIDVFRRYFWLGFVLPLWKSVFQHKDGLYVPCLSGHAGDRVTIGTKWLCDTFSPANPAPRFKEHKSSDIWTNLADRKLE